MQSKQTILRYSLMPAFESPNRKVKLQMPREHTFLHIGLEPQGKAFREYNHCSLTEFGCLSAWFLIGADDPKEEITFQIAGTGMFLLEPDNPLHTLVPLGSAVLSKYVWHLFEEKTHADAMSQL